LPGVDLKCWWGKLAGLHLEREWPVGYRGISKVEVMKISLLSSAASDYVIVDG
jgi:hypothetical protein